MQFEYRAKDLQLLGIGVSIGCLITRVWQDFNDDPLINYKLIENLLQNVQTLKLLGVLSLVIIIVMEAANWVRHINSESKKVEINAQDLNTVLAQLSEVLKNLEAERDKLKPSKNVAYIEDLNSDTENDPW